jgi:hypothetical protein
MPKVIDLSVVKANRRHRVLYKNVETPWVKIPNVRYFGIDIGKIDVFFALFGIKRTHRTMVEIIPYKSKKINRYVEHQIIRLGKARDSQNSKLYFHICDVLMKRSNVFRVLAINHVFNQ